MALPPSWKSDVQKAVEEKIDADRDQRQAQQSEASAKVVAAIKTLSDAQNTQTAHDDRNEKINVWLAAITIFLVFLTVVFTGASWWVFSSQLDEMKNASSIARQAMERQLRPYLSVKSGEFPLLDWQGRVTAINRGQTPAREVQFLVSWDTDPRCGHISSGFPYHYAGDGSGIVDPRAQKKFFDHRRAFARDDEDTATFTLSGDLTEASKAATVCIYGAFLYVTPNGDSRDTHFCWWYRPGKRSRDLCEDQNDLD